MEVWFCQKYKAPYKNDIHTGNESCQILSRTCHIAPTGNIWFVIVYVLQETIFICTEDISFPDSVEKKEAALLFKLYAEIDTE